MGFVFVCVFASLDASTKQTMARHDVSIDVARSMTVLFGVFSATKFTSGVVTNQTTATFFVSIFVAQISIDRYNGNRHVKSKNKATTQKKKKEKRKETQYLFGYEKKKHVQNICTGLPLFVPGFFCHDYYGVIVQCDWSGTRNLRFPATLP